MKVKMNRMDKDYYLLVLKVRGEDKFEETKYRDYEDADFDYRCAMFNDYYESGVYQHIVRGKVDFEKAFNDERGDA